MFTELYLERSQTSTTELFPLLTDVNLKILIDDATPLHNFEFPKKILFYC